MDVVVACEQEVIGLHRFFEAWFRGEFADRERGFRRFAEVMDPGFAIVSPRGMSTQLDALSEGLRGAYGTWEPGWSIEVRDVAVRHLHADVVLVTYVEAQHVRGKDTARLSSAWLRQDESTPNGMRWLHVHETWMPGMAG